jgi:hypothetical protein
MRAPASIYDIRIEGRNYPVSQRMTTVIVDAVLLP